MVREYRLAMRFAFAIVLMCLCMLSFLWAQPDQAAAQSFSDVPASAWHKPYVDYVSSNGLMGGYNNPANEFGPDDSVTRGMVATVLYRYATGDSGANGQVTNFSDVPKGMWYTKAIEWCRQKGVVTGYGGTTRFGPDDPVTREQLATMLYRFAGLYGVSRSGLPLNFPDSYLISSYAAEAMAWCNSAGILTGNGQTGAAMPQDTANRGQLAKMLTVLCRDVFGGGATPAPAPTPISKATLTLSQTTYTYDGTAKTPGVTVKVGTTTLKQGTDYTVSYARNTDVGTATATVTGKGDYTGSLAKTFTISAASVSSATVTLSASTFTYDGTAKKPTVVVKLGSSTLKSGTDYSVSYASNINAGTARVTVTGKGNCTGTVTKTFTISAASIAATSVALDASSVVYSGSAKSPGVTVKVGSTTLKSGTDYTVSYSNNVNAGTATATVTAKGNYKGTVAKTFTISRASIPTSVTLSQTFYTYSGTEHKPAVTVKSGTVTLKSGTDYTVSYSANVNAGTAKVTVTGIGNYTGSTAKTYTIVAADIADESVSLASSSLPYDGTAKTPGVTVKVSGRQLVAGTDYTVSYANNTAVSTAAAKASVTVSGKGNYKGTVTKTFDITAADMSGATMALSQATYAYDGTPKMPLVTVSLESTTLSPGVDYQLVYTNNTRVGTAKVTATGRGNYSGEVSERFTIEAANASGAAVTIFPSSFAYDGNAKTPLPTVRLGDKTLVKDTDYTVQYANNTNAGTATVTVTFKGNYSGTASKTFSIDNVGIAGATATLSQTAYIYDGQAKTPGITVKVGDRTLTPNVDYTVSYANNTMVGTATLTVTGKGNYTGSLAKTFTISAASIATAEVRLAQYRYSYDGSEKKPAVTAVVLAGKTLTAGTDYTVAYSDNTVVGTARATVTGKGNYTGSASVEFTIVPQALIDISPATVSLSKTSYIYDGTAKTPAVTSAVLAGKTLTAGTDYSVAYANNVSAGTATVTLRGEGGYTGTVSATFQIDRADISGATVTLSPTSYVYDGQVKTPEVTVVLSGKTLTAGIDYTVAYSDNTAVGTACATVAGKGNYTGSASAQYVIAAPSPTGLAGATVTLSQTSYVYDGSAKTPGVTVGLGGKTLSLGTDYTVAYSNNVAAGTATATVTGMGGYSGTASASFQIARASISNATVVLSQTSYTFDGSAKTPVATVTFDGKRLTPDTDYTVSYSNNTAIGTATATVSGMGNYGGMVSASFAIEAPAAKSISDASATLSEITYTYDGAAKTPAVTVMLDGKTLVAGTDYSVAYSDNVNAGMASVTISGKGGYTGTLSLPFQVLQADVSDATIALAQTSYTYDGNSKTPGVTVRFGGKTLVSGTDYALSYFGNIDAGTARVTVAGKGNFTGTTSTTFQISQAGIAGVTVTLSQTSYTYDGTAKTPGVTVTTGGKTLTSGVDYTVSYSNNVAAGTATAFVTGMGNYFGTATASYSIGTLDISRFSVALSQTSYTYDGSAKTPSVTVTHLGKALTSGADFTVAYSNNLTAGTATATVTGKGNYSGTAAASFTIGKADLSAATVTLSQNSYTYDGTAKVPGVTVVLSGKTLTAGSDYTVSYTDNVAAGIATVTVAGFGNYYGTVTATFSISENSIAGATVTLSKTSYDYDGKAKRPTATVVFMSRTLIQNSDYTVSYANNTNAGTAVVTITGIGEYSGTATCTFTINPLDLTAGTISFAISTYYYSIEPQKPMPSVKLSGKTLTSGRDYTLSYSGNDAVGTATVTATGEGNYRGSISTTFTIVQTSVSDGTMALNDSSLVYDGTAKEPQIVVTVYGETLRRDVDYTVELSGNVTAGSATVVVRGMGGFAGSMSKTFYIHPADVSGATVTLPQTDYPYDGNAKMPVPTVVMNGRTLVPSTDFSLAYSNNSSIGTATVTVRGEGNYTGSISAHFTISSSSLSIADATLSQTSYVYDGNPKTPDVTVTFQGATLVRDRDYSVAYVANVNAGTATATVRGMGSYSGAVVKTFTIEKATIASSMVSLPQTSYVYNGSSKTPAVSVEFGGRYLEAGTDYTVVYQNNVLAGTASVTVTGIGNFKGTVVKEFSILTADLSAATIMIVPDSYTYTGEALRPNVYVSLGDVLLAQDVDYTLTYTNNVNSGLAVVTVVGKGSCTGSLASTFQIRAANLSVATITLSTSSYTYDGWSKKPTVTVRLGDTTLVSGTDYDVSYENNTAVGAATATVTGKGNYTGTLSRNFVITPASISKATVTVTPSSVVCDGTPKIPSVRVVLSGRQLTANRDYEVSYSDNVDCGTATVTVRGIGNYSGTKTATFQITAILLDGATVELSQTSYVYSGSAKCPAVVVTRGTDVLAQGTDYSVAYANNVNAGTATVAVTGVGNYAGTITRTFTIEKASMDNVRVQMAYSRTTYTGEAKTPAVTAVLGSKGLVPGEDYDLTYTGNVNVGTAVVVLQGKGNFDGGVVKSFQIVAASISSATVNMSPMSFVYDGGAKTPAISLTLGGRDLVGGTDYELVYQDNVNVGTATVAIEARGNYVGTLFRTFTIVSGDLAGASMTISPSSVTYDGAAKTPSVTLVVGGRTLTAGDDFALLYTNNVAAGTATVTATGRGNYTGRISGTFTIARKSIPQSAVTLTGTSFPYGGAATTPQVTVTVSGKELVLDTDYTVSYSNNTAVGSASMTVTGKGNYSGSVTKTFTIVSANLSGATVALSQYSYAYDGTAKTPDVTVSMNGAVYRQGVDYTVSYSNNVNKGVATVTVTGIGSCTGSASVSFAINDTSIATASIALNPTGFTYDGTPKTPSTTVLYKNKTLVQGTDYTVEYLNNVLPGTATVVVTGKGIFGGVATKNFTIATTDISTTATISIAPRTVDYNGDYQTPEVTVVVAGVELIRDVDYTLSYSGNKMPGNALVSVRGIGGYKGTASANFTIRALSISGARVTVATPEVIYSGSAQRPAVSVVLNGQTLVENSDYLVSYSGNTSVGTANVSITGIGGYSGVAGTTFRIVEPPIQITRSSSNSNIVDVGRIGYIYTTKPVVSVESSNEDVMLAYVSESTDYLVRVLAVEPGRSTVTVTDEQGNTASIEMTVTASIGGTVVSASSMDITMPVPQIESVNYDRDSITVTSQGDFDSGTFDGYEFSLLYEGASPTFTVVWENDDWNNSGMVFLTQYNTTSPGRTYTVRLRSYKLVGNAVVYSAWSESRSVTIPNYNGSEGSEAAYTYDVVVLGEADMDIYSGYDRVVYVRTDNPDSSSLRLVDADGDSLVTTLTSYSGGHYFDDIQYASATDYSNAFKAVDGGYIAYIRPSVAGAHSVQLREYGASGYSVGWQGVWNVVDTDEAIEVWIDEVLAVATNGSMTPFEKMASVSAYLSDYVGGPGYFRYLTNSGDILVNIASMPNGPFFETLRWDSMESPAIMCRIAQRIGGFDDVHNCYYDYARSDPMWSQMHFMCRVTIGADVQYFQACPASFSGDVSGYSYVDFSNLEGLRHFAPGALRSLSGVVPSLNMASLQLETEEVASVEDASEQVEQDASPAATTAVATFFEDGTFAVSPDGSFDCGYEVVAQWEIAPDAWVTGPEDLPWHDYRGLIRKVVFATGLDGSFVTVADLSWWFAGCGGLEELDLGGLVADENTLLFGWLDGCDMLQTVFGGVYFMLELPTVQVFEDVVEMEDGVEDFEDYTEEPAPEPEPEVELLPEPEPEPEIELEIDAGPEPDVEYVEQFEEESMPESESLDSYELDAA